MLFVTKATGEEEPFAKEKLLVSIRRAGIPADLENEVVKHIEEKLYDGIPTLDIYRHIKEYLKSSKHSYVSAKYSLKQAIMDLGPTGYPFEDYISKIMRSQGYETVVRTTLLGKCISHEIDVIAQKPNEKIMVEAKFHHIPGTKTNVHVALYTKARFDDVREQHGFTKAWLVTNTKVTLDAIAYGGCSDMRITGWGYPDGESLREIVEKANLIPLTALISLSHYQKVQLLEAGTVLVKDIVDNKDALAKLGLPSEKVEVIRKEALQCLGIK